MICGLTARMITSASAHERGIVRDGPDPVALRDLSEVIRSGVRGGDGAGRHEARLGQALDQRLAHVARAKERHALALDAHAPPSVTAVLGARGPKIAVPTRTMVAPSSIATSKSPLIPIEQCSRPDCVAQLAEPLEPGPRRLRALRRGRDAHEPAHVEVAAARHGVEQRA